MARKIYDPAIAARVKKEIYNYIHDLAERRIVTISSIVSIALDEYVEKCKRIEKSLEK